MSEETPKPPPQAPPPITMEHAATIGEAVLLNPDDAMTPDIAFEFWWEENLKEDIIPPVGHPYHHRVRDIAFSAFMTGISWATTKSPAHLVPVMKFLANLRQHHPGSKSGTE